MKINFILFLTLCFSAEAFASEPNYGLSYFGELKYPQGFPHFDYVNPDAPKGGKLSQGVIGTFNNLHPYIDKGRPAACIDIGCMLIYDMLLKPSEDELASSYGLMAESVELADDFTWVNFTLNPKARWHDGKPVTVEDVVWTFKTIKSDAALGWKTSYKDIVAAEKVGPRTVRFHFSSLAPKTPQLARHISMFWAMPKHYWEGREFHATTLDPPMGSGPYKIAKVDPGHKIVYERVADYWARDLNVNVGSHNVDIVEFQYFLDKNVIIEAHKAHVFDFRGENDAKSWATAYDFKARDLGLFRMERRPIRQAVGLRWGILFNTRIDKLNDVRVREALTLAYNFEWANRVLQYGEYERTGSFFQGSDMESIGTLPNEQELALLEPFRDELPARIFTEVFSLPVTTGEGRDRESLIRASKLLEEAGWVIKDFRRVHKDTGEPFTLNFLMRSVDEERSVMPYVDTLKRLGIESKVRTVETSQYRHRIRHFDFEVTGQGLRQGNIPFSWLLRSRFQSVNAHRANTDNYAGIEIPAVDFLLEKIIAAASEEEMNVAGRALDRILLWNFFVIPSAHSPFSRQVYWDKFDDPKIAKNRTGWFDLWWIDPVKNARIEAGIGALEASSR